MKRIEELTLKLVDGEITDDEAMELGELTQSSDGRDLFLRLMEVESHLLSAGRSTCADRVTDALRLQRCQSIEDGVMSAVVIGGLDETSELAGRAEPAVATKLGYRAVRGFALVAVLAIMVAIAVWPRSDERLLPILVELVASESSVVVSDEASHTIQTLTDANQSIPLRAGQSVETPCSMDFAELLYPDGTRIELLGNTKVTLSSTENDAKKLTVVAGTIQADVTPQAAGRPLQIVTSTATLEVLGTTLGVEVHTDSTQLEVASGLVAITRNVDDQRVDVSEGHFVRATGSTKDAFEAAPFPAVPSDWTADLSSGLPEGWSGKVVETGVGFGVLASAANEARQRNFSITTQNAWQLGEHALFQVHDDSVLHIRFQQSKFARITVMVGARVFPPEKRQFGANLFYTKKEWSENLAADQWKTIAIPLREVGWHIRRRAKQGGAPDLNGLAAYLIQVTTMERDVGLIVDRMWVTRGPQEQTQ